MRSVPSGRRHGAIHAALIAFAIVLVPWFVLAQASPVFDHTKAPELGKPARLVVPAVVAIALPNGVRLRVVEQHELPLVHISIVVDGGVLRETAHDAKVFRASAVTLSRSSS